MNYLVVFLLIFGNIRILVKRFKRIFFKKLYIELFDIVSYFVMGVDFYWDVWMVVFKIFNKCFIMDKN